MARIKTCAYCKMTIPGVPTTCPMCKKTFCVYHKEPERHHCEAVDWEEMKKARYAESDARFKRVMKKVALERSIRTISTIIGSLILIALVWFLIVPAINNVDFSKILVFHATSIPDEHNISILVFQYTNDERAKHNLGMFDEDPQLRAAADWQSECLSMNNLLEHETVQCGTLEDRYARFGVAYTIAGENLALGWDARAYYSGSETPTGYLTNEEIARSIVDGWMDSPGHRTNILDAVFGRMGIGVYYNDTTHKIITTQNFAE